MKCGRLFSLLPVYVCVLTISFLMACISKKKRSSHKPLISLSRLESNFITPRDSLQTSIYWYWMSDNLSKEGVIKDLYAMKQVGINRAFIGNIGYPSMAYGKVKIFSDEWWDIMHAALKTATELNIEIGIFNSPGWSQSGGPWVKPEQAMRYLASTELKVKGPLQLNRKLEKSADQFQDVKVIAFQAPEGYEGTNGSAHKFTANPSISNIKNINDGNQETEVVFPEDKSLSIDIENPTGFTVRSIEIHPAKKRMRANVELFINENSGYRSLKRFVIDRSKDNLHVGFAPYGPVAVSIPATTSKSFRLTFSNYTPGFSVSEIQLSLSPKVERYIEKSLAKMFQAPLAYWSEYQWPVQPIVENKNLMINPNEVLDISGYMNPDGTLNWAVPKGDWVIMRYGMVPTGVQNGPASPEGIGLEVDKMSKEHVKAHFNAFLGDIIRRIPAQDRKTWKVAVLDSYETGGQNWTDGFIEKFKKNYGYTPLPYLPVLTGKVVGNPDMSDRFLWDLRRFVADRIAYDYVGGLRDVSHQHGLTTWLENYGHWGFPGEFLQYGGQSDEIGGEFWNEGELGNIENRAASSAAHIYGKTKVSAESFTSGGKSFIRYPALLKQRGDRFFTEGINNTLLHVFIHQPDNRVPGVSTNFGTEFNRHNTWFNQLDLFTAYLKRTNYMLQQGKYVADVAYFIGEDTPKMTGITDPALPAGYSYDYINGEVINERLKVENGRLVLPDGMSYRLLVLPQLETIRPELLRKIRDLVAGGATILGPRPKRSPSLQNYPSADSEIEAITADLWGKIDGKDIQSNKYGKGLVLTGMDMQTALHTLNIIPDFKIDTKEPVLFIHRTSADGDIYYVSNQSEQTVNITPEFRITGKQPEFWDPVSGSVRNLPEFSQKENSTEVPLKLVPSQSAFILFRKPVERNHVPSAVTNFPDHRLLFEISDPWEVHFDNKMRGPLQPVIFKTLTDWSKHKDENIKYYSGTAIYHNSFNVDKLPGGEHFYLDLGKVTAMAKIKINDVYVGGVWTAPWQLDITDFLKKGKNKLEIEVVNTWVNRLIGDSKLPSRERKTWTTENPYTPASPLQPSGLLGPVRLQTVKYDYAD